MSALEGISVQLSQNFQVITCYKADCGVNFAVPYYLQKQLRDTKRTFYCPHGHSQAYTGATEEDRLRQRLQWAKEREKTLREERDRAEHRVRGYKAAVTRTKHRVGNGVCPCCNRTFQNLMNHMKTKHPQYKGKKK